MSRVGTKSRRTPDEEIATARREANDVSPEIVRKDVDEIPGGHLVALSNPRGLADRLLAYIRRLRK
jgi:hypothetical protein